MNSLRNIILLSLLSIWHHSFAQNEKPSVYNIGVNQEYREGNWEPFLKSVENKKMVLLGELNHGSHEIFITRNEIIKALHQQLDFDVILFESGVGELAAIDFKIDSLSEAQLVGGFFGNWRAEEFKELMSYAKNNQLEVAGIDVQKTGSVFTSFLQEVAKNNSIDPVFYEPIEERFDKQKSLLTNRQAEYDSLKSDTEKLVLDYQALWDQFQQIDNLSKESKLVQKTIENRIAYLRYFLEFTRTKDWNARWKARDEMIASNVEWFIENLFKNQKVIIVAHNFHIAKYNEKEEVMGEFLRKKYDTEMYSLGVFAGSGSFADNSGNTEKMEPIATDENDIKKHILALEGRVQFIDIPKPVGLKRNFLFDEITINDTFIDLFNSNKIVLEDHFDGVLFIDKISPSN